MPIRNYGFRKILDHYPEEIVEIFLEYHQYNAGLSRFHKIKYFYNELLQKDISDEKIKKYAEEFSKIMRSKLTDKKYLIKETLDFIKNNQTNYIFHIVSGSEQHELRYLCEKLEIAYYFNSIRGSPTPKNHLVKEILEQNKYKINECILIGDSINDYDAAKINEIQFYGYNNIYLKDIGNKYIETFRKGW
jgi:HAD superfamily hydrolase (TIGR01549 family)